MDGVETPAIGACIIGKSTPRVRSNVFKGFLLSGNKEPTIFTIKWSDRLDEFFVEVTLERLAGVGHVGHYTPREAPGQFDSAINKRLAEPVKTES